MKIALFSTLICLNIRTPETISFPFGTNGKLMVLDVLILKGRFLKFGRYHNFANLFSKLSESTFYKEISKFQ